MAAIRNKNKYAHFRSGAQRSVFTCTNKRYIRICAAKRSNGRICAAKRSKAHICAARRKYLREAQICAATRALLAFARKSRKYLRLRRFAAIICAVRKYGRICAANRFRAVCVHARLLRSMRTRVHTRAIRPT